MDARFARGPGNRAVPVDATVAPTGVD